MRPFLTLHDPALARAYYADGLWRSETLHRLMVLQAEERPDAIALVDGRRQLAWQELAAEVDGLAAAFEDLGLAAGDRISLWLSNRMEAVIAFLAASRQGIACNPSLHRTYTCAEIASLLKRLGAKLLITEAGWGADRADRKAEERLAQIDCLTALWGCRRAARTRSPAKASAADKPRQRDLSGLHLRHHRSAQVRDAFLQHSAGQCPRPGTRLVAGERRRALEPQPPVASHRLGRGRTVARQRLPAGDRRPAGRLRPARLGPGERRHLCHGRADPCHGHPRPTESADPGAPGCGPHLLHGRCCDPAIAGRSLRRARHHPRRTSTA